MNECKLFFLPSTLILCENGHLYDYFKCKKEFTNEKAIKIYTYFLLIFILAACGTQQDSEKKVSDNKQETTQQDQAFP